MLNSNFLMKTKHNKSRFPIRHQHLHSSILTSFIHTSYRQLLIDQSLQYEHLSLRYFITNPTLTHRFLGDRIPIFSGIPISNFWLPIFVHLLPSISNNSYFNKVRRKKSTKGRKQPQNASTWFFTKSKQFWVFFKPESKQFWDSF